MAKKQSGIVVPRQELSKVLDAYNVIGTFLETYLGRESFYRREFLRGLDAAIDEVERGQTEEAKTFDEFIS